MMIPELSKGHLDTIFKTVVLVGNGAIENGSLPLQEAMSSLFTSDDLHPLVQKLQSKESEMFHQLAVLSYKYRLEKTQFYKLFLKSGDLFDKVKIKKYFESTNILNNFIKLRSNISNCYEKATSLKIRETDKIRSLIGDNPLYITTNWDNELWKSKVVKNCIYLHGRCGFQESIVMATELLIEDTMYDPPSIVMDKLKEANDFELVMILNEILRYSPMQQLFSNISISTDKVRRADKLVLWGFSLADYDADINALVGLWDGSVKEKELIVINPDQYVLNRAIGLTNCPNATLYDPVNDLTVKIQ